MKNTPATAPRLVLRPRWLVVDDQPEVAAVLKETLEALDCASVEAFTQPRLALARVQESPRCFDVVVTDRDMPGLDGLELSRRLHALCPGMRVVLVTGRPEGLSARALREAGIAAVVAKPFSLADLEAAVLSEEVLTRAA